MARTFNGSSDSIDVNSAHSFVVGSPFSWFCWAKATTQSTKFLYSEGRSTTPAPVASFVANGQLLRLFFVNDAAAITIDQTGTAIVFNGAWHSIAVVQDATSLGSWVDGTPDLSGISRPASATTLNIAALGTWTRSTGKLDFLGGSLAHFASWSRALTQAEISALAVGLPPSSLSPDHYWPLAGTQSPEPDLGSSAVTGAVTGTTPGSDPPVVGLPSFIASWGRRPVPMIKGPDTDKLLGMRGIYH